MECILRHAASTPFGDAPIRERRKNLGRFQRPINYTTAGDLIIPDWVRIQAFVTFNRGVAS